MMQQQYWSIQKQGRIRGVKSTHSKLGLKTIASRRFFSCNMTCIGVTGIERTPLMSMRPWLSSGAVYKKGALIGLSGVWLLRVWFSDWP